MNFFRCLCFCVLLLFPFAGSSQQTDSSGKEAADKVKQMEKRLRGQWWLLHKTVSTKEERVYYKQETHVYATGTSDTLRPLMRIEFKKKGVLLTHEFPYMKARLAKEGSYRIEVKIVSATEDKYFLYLSDELKAFIGIAEPIEIRFVKKNLLLADAAFCTFNFRAD